MPSKVKEKAVQLVSPIGTASYPFLTRPDTKFDSDGEYRVGLLLSATEAQEMMKAIDAAMTDSLEKAKKENPQKAKKIQMAKPPYFEVTDDDGNETVDIQFNFKLKAKVTPRNGGEPIELRPKLFDAAGTPIVSKDIRIGSGSRIKVCADISPYHTDLVGAGVTLRLKAVQIIELVEYLGQSADKFGFGVETGYTQAGTEATEEPSDDEADF